MNDMPGAPATPDDLLNQVLNPHPDAMFWRPSRLGVDSAWYGHVPFAHWLVASIRPGVLVELGSHAGVSYCGFCEAVQRANLDTRCMAVDTWTGDEHAGFYGEGVYQDLRVFHDARYGGFSSLLRTTFDAALAYIADGSVDLLHIDGRHLYEDVRHDFDTWRPKLSQRAVVLFHDTYVRERDFGVWRLWAEESSRVPHFEFLHGYGLGVLCVGETPPEAVEALCRLPPASVAQVRERFATLGERWMLESTSRRLEGALADQRAHVVVLEAKFREMEAYATALAARDGQREPARAELRAALSRASTAEQELRLAGQRHAQAQAKAAVAEALAAQEAAEMRTRRTETEARAAVAAALANQELAQLRAKSAETEALAAQELAQARAQAEVLRHELKNIVASRSWRMVRRLSRARAMVRGPRPGLPPASLDHGRHPLLAAPEAPLDDAATSAIEVDAAVMMFVTPAEDAEADPIPAGEAAAQSEDETLPVPEADMVPEAPAEDAWPTPAIDADARPPSRRPRVLFAAGEPGTPGCTYRCIRYAETAAALGWEARWKDFGKLNPQDLIGTDLVVLWRVTWSEHIAGVIEHVHRFGGRVALDLDDLMIRPELARVDCIDAIRSINWSEQHVRGMFVSTLQVLEQVDFGIATTAELAAEMRRWPKAAYVLPNGFDAETFRRSRKAARQRALAPQDGLVRIGYATGSRTHQRDLAEAADAIAAVLRARPQVRLVAFRAPRDNEGLVMFDEFAAFAELMDQIEWRMLVSLEELPEELARFDINIAPLQQGNPFVEAKSELKYFEAAIAGVPTVASPTGPYRRAIVDGQTGLLAADPAQWESALLQLVDDPALRRRMAVNACNDVLWQFGPQRRAGLLQRFLEQHRGGDRPADGAALGRAFALDLQVDPPAPARVPPVQPTETLFAQDRLGEAGVTVVIASFNYADYIQQALESVRLQTLELLDLVVVDDCSTDPDTLEQILDWAHVHAARFNRLLVLRHHQNTGLGGTRNTGFSYAETSYVLPLDADNRLLPECAQHLLEAMQASGGAAFAYPFLAHFGAENRVTGGERYEPQRLVGGNYIDAMALVARWAWAAAGGYYVRRDAMGWEDFSLWCRFAERGFWGEAVPEVLAEYRVHQNSMINSITETRDNKQAMVEIVEQRHPWLRLTSRDPYERRLTAV
jgi:glycosyltransferase involved in cell wall biosynthesis